MEVSMSKVKKSLLIILAIAVVTTSVLVMTGMLDLNFIQRQVTVLLRQYLPRPVPTLAEKRTVVEQRMGIDATNLSEEEVDELLANAKVSTGR